MKNKIYIIIAVLAVLLVLFAFIPRANNAPVTTTEPSSARSNGKPASGDITLALWQKAQVGDLTVQLQGPIEDSRCMNGVQCIWAGEVRTTILLNDGKYSDAISISSDKKVYTFYSHTISLTSVTPAPKTVDQKILPEDYRVTFHVDIAPPGL